MSNWFSYDGFRTDGILVERKNTLGLPVRDVEKIRVPGRNGDILIDRESYQNVRVSYDCAARDVAALETLRSALTHGRGYRLLTDSYHPWQRLAMFSSALNIDELIVNRVFKFTVVFDCKPQRWHDRALNISGTNSVIVTRPSGYRQSDPRIEITGTGNVSLRLPAGDLPLGSITSTVVIDSEAMVAFRVNNNGTRTAIDLPFWPQLTAQGTNVQTVGNVTRIQIQPRWWTL